MPDVPIHEGHHDDGPFNRSAAVNAAADAAGDWDLGLVIDADIFIRRRQVLAALDTALSTGRPTWAHRRWRGINEHWTRRLVDDRYQHTFPPEIDDPAYDMDVLVERTTPISWSCCIAIPRAAWDRLGGFDERFVGWGFEDMAFQSAVCGLLGHERIEGDVYHLWHPRSEERIVEGQPASTSTVAHLTNARLGRRYMLALRRDHSLHDRPGMPATEEERLRDIANLRRDDAKLDLLARRAGLPDWTDWWPTLEELVAGSRAARGTGRGEVAVIVRTGGDPGTWPERSAYLRRSLESLASRVGGPVVQRVVYSDWGAERAEELAAIAGAHGFYVAGDGHHGYTAAVQRLWRYIDRRVIAPYVFLTEDDFVYERDVDLSAMVAALREDRALAQVALLRAPAYARELEPGDHILAWPRDSFRPAGSGATARLEHRNFWTMNPSVFRRELSQVAWPSRPSSERAFGDALARNPSAKFALLGGGEAWVRHIGETRAAESY